MFVFKFITSIRSIASSKDKGTHADLFLLHKIIMYIIYAIKIIPRTMKRAH